METIKIKIETTAIKLDQFLKWANIVASGGEAKNLILDEKVKVNGETTTQRGKNLKAGDIVTLGETNYQVQ